MSSSEPPASDSGAGPPDGYLLHVLPAIDAVLIYVTLRGEHVGTYFGATEEAATAAVAADLLDRTEAGS